MSPTEHELRAAGSRCPSFTTHIFTGLGDADFEAAYARGRNRDGAKAEALALHP